MLIVMIKVMKNLITDDRRIDRESDKYLIENLIDREGRLPKLGGRKTKNEEIPTNFLYIYTHQIGKRT